MFDTLLSFGQFRSLALNAYGARLTPVVRHGLWLVIATLCLMPLSVTANKEQGRQGDNGTDSIMARIYRYPARLGQALPEAWTMKVYAAHTLHTRRKNILTRYVPGLFKLQRGEHNYFGESLNLYEKKASGIMAKTELAAYGTMPYRSRDEVWLGQYNPSIYADGLFSDRILSPLWPSNRRYYRFAVKGSRLEEGRQIVCINVTPRFSNTQLVRGDFDADAETGRVCRFSFDFVYGLGRLHFEGEMGRSGLASLVPRRMALVSRLSVLGNKIDETFDATALYDFADVGSRRPTATTDIWHTTTDTVVRQKAFFDAYRPRPLSSEQIAVYERSDTTTGKTDTVSRPIRRFISPGTENMLFDSHVVTFSPTGFVKLPPLLTPRSIGWSRSKGFSLQTRFVFSKQWPQRCSLEFSPRVGYNFKQKQVYWRLPLRMDLYRLRSGSLTLEASGGDHAYSSRQADEIRRQLAGHTEYDSLIHLFDQYQFHYYRDNRLLASLSVSPLPHVTLQTGMRLHHRTLIGWNETAAEGGMKHYLSSIAPRVQIIWTPQRQTSRMSGRHYSLWSGHPMLMADYERGFSIGRASTRYERIETDLRYTLPLRALRAIHLRVGAGLYTRRGPDSFIDYDHFRDEWMPQGWRDELSGQFQLLDSRWYNESDHYARLSTAYESPMLLISRIGKLTRYVQKERLYFNLLHVKALGPYGEFGYGISLPMIDFGAFMSIANGRATKFAVKIALNLGGD